MRRGDFPAAWRVSDAVLAARDPAGRDNPALPYHQRWVWDGRALDGQDVLVRCYHGLGDTIQFARFLPALAARARRVTVEVQPELLRLLAAQAWPVRLMPFDPAHPLPPGGVDVEVMELCHALRLAPDGAAYLQASPVRSGGVGACWAAGGWDPARSMPARLLARMLPAGTVGLQRGAAPLGWVAGMADGDVLDTAQVITGLARVVSVDTMVAHLAGALGRPTCVMLKAEADWRWGLGERVAWYGSVRAARQVAAGDWGCCPALVKFLGTYAECDDPLDHP